jgi:hypothetical protein
MRILIIRTVRLVISLAHRFLIARILKVSKLVVAMVTRADL